MCAKALDVGTCFIVGAELKEGKEVFKSERDAFFVMPNKDFAEEMLTNAGAFYVVKGDQLYVVGEDALKFSQVTGNTESYRRPMAKGVLNPTEEDAVSMIKVMIEGVIGKAAYPGEVCAVTIPANPVDASFNITYHEMVICKFLRDLGYEPKAINEALGIVFSENPTVSSKGEVLPFTGIGVSFGAGMVNLVAAWRAQQLLAFSAGRSGDWIDAEVARVRNMPVSHVIHVKERELDLTTIDDTDQTQVALDIYYEDLIRYVLDHFKKEFKRTSASIKEPVEICIGGGTASVPGFVQKFEKVLSRTPFPFDVKNVRLAKDPLKCVTAGALIAAISEEKKRKRKGGAAAK
ncbi:MAG: hypothetical protein HY719_14285 [Planctomycetes bacterium]|nr:hypothetical protein [Planctomycetota bacterium]